ncbi:MAG TPA: hypothetical protein PLK37_12130 [Terricaulis sp.]|nr:hypothetical protein [Terricaulis sp.]
MFSQLLAGFRAEAPVLAGSAAVVLFMVGMAYALGFRAKRLLNEAELARLAEAEGASLEGAVIAPDKRAAFARLGNGKLMVARVMGDDVSARIAPAAAMRVAVTQGRLHAVFADLGFPPLHMKLEETPPWLAELAQGGR